MDVEPFVKRFKSHLQQQQEMGLKRPQIHLSSNSGPYQKAAVGTVLAGEASEYLEDRLQRSKH